MPKIEEKLELVNLGSPEEIRTFEKGKVELATINGKVIGRGTFEPGWKWSTCVKPLAKTRSCESAHFGYQISGTMKVVFDSGEEKLMKAGDVGYIPPGHDAWVVGNEPVVFIDFQGLEHYAQAPNNR